MTRGLLIAGNESTLSTAIVAEAGRRFELFCAALVPNRLPYPLEGRSSAAGPAAKRGVPAGGPGRGPILLDWNPGSPVSTRALVLAAENRLGRIDEAVLVCVPPAVRKNAEDLNSANIEIIVNDHIKGWFFLAKELAAVFKARGAGSLALALSDTAGGGDRDDTDLIGPPVSASFRSFGQALMDSSRNEQYDVFGFAVPGGGFSGGADGGDSVGAFVFKALEDGRRNRGKWHKFGSRLSFLSR
jgi:NAD(P)-dependent dehydrogenase (short-subunit alcohol dehydrogenase family)